VAHSGAVEAGVVSEAPAAIRPGASPVAIRLVAFPAAIPPEASPVAVSLAAMAGVAEAVENLRCMNRKEGQPILFFFQSLTGITEGCKFTLK